LDTHEGLGLREARWEKTLRAGLRRHRKSESDALRAAKGAGWKIEIAARLRTECLTPNAWIARRLHMGQPRAVSFYVGRWLRQQT